MKKYNFIEILKQHLKNDQEASLAVWLKEDQIAWCYESQFNNRTEQTYREDTRWAGLEARVAEWKKWDVISDMETRWV